jgi:hypothetical protein
MVTLASNMVLALAAMLAPAALIGPWEKLYEVPSKNQWIISVWLAQDASWRVSLPHLLVRGDAQGVRTTDTGEYGVLGFGEDSSGTIIGFGSRQAIWEENASTFVRVHERRQSRPRDRAARWDYLDGLGYFDPAHPDRLVAYASTNFSLWRGPDRTWRVADDNRPALRAVEGPVARPPKGCDQDMWIWLDRADGLLVCREGHSYLYANGALAATLAAMPKACHRSMTTVARTGNNLFVSCGDAGQVWHLRIGTGNWATVPGIGDVRSLNARNGCLLVGTRRSVYRRCGW